ncbi:hypothetical protein GLOTRDRAFT_127110 [Gloeophyllum trabeum ATCC 11539]|uniref:Shr3 amino acid permease chaperone n=1 Tax=Gloeophyllum trabeum (strain ATCC 11539 / FP-39264 / Madison 617) TaxID=670483 RepID=S7QH81_GLOTA|nr:uncharacterized protein GLOTRDRAFT_127110 [Gloeophyllum trabeum ATCC 11539]EPQ58613.1 hypothetical protein GLOTRDRAFT_127110 [Gloeophyllum trabeum ATCC 11539]
MAWRVSFVVCVTSFLLGTLFTHWIADSLTLWKSPEISDEHLWTAAAYYSILARMPEYLLYFLTATACLGGITILWSLGDGQAGNLMFDGGSIFLYGSAAAVYLYSVLPTLSTFKSLPLHTASTVYPPNLRTLTLDLASNNLICSVALTGILLLQAGRWWAENRDGNDDDAPVMDKPENADGVRERTKSAKLRKQKTKS